MKKLLFSLLIAAFICVSSISFAFDKQMGKLDFPESGYSEAIAQAHVSISVQGTGYGLVPVWNEKDERIEYEWGLGTFESGGSGFVTRGNYVVTAAHVVLPKRVLLQTGTSVYYNVLLRSVATKEISVANWGTQGPPLEVIYIDEEMDVALLKFKHPRIPFKESPIEIAQTFSVLPVGFFGTMFIDRIEPGDAICTIVHKRNEETAELEWTYEIRTGKVRAPNPMTGEGQQQYLPFLCMNDFTMDLEILPGDSGSPIIAFAEGKPIIIGIARARILRGDENWTYATRIDPIYPMLWAVR